MEDTDHEQIQKLVSRHREAWSRRGFILLPALAFGLWFWAFAVPAGNFWIKISISAAAVAGAFWGAFYWGSRNLTAAIISHSIWSTVIFTILPLH